MDPERCDAWYDSVVGAAAFEHELWLLERAAAGAAPGNVLEVGCGTGRFLEAIGHGAQLVVGMDIEAAMLGFARRRGPAHGAPPAAFVRGDALALPFRDESFDLVFESTLLCFVADPAAVIREMARVSRPGGRIILGELNPWSPWQLWRRLKGALGLGSFRGARWHRPGALLEALETSGCRAERVGRAVFSPPVELPDVFRWRSATERAGALLWPWAGAYYVLRGVKA